MYTISVILPMFRAKHIGWLPLESLCRQQEVNFEWELIIAEEVTKKYDPMGEKKIIQEYQDRLKLVGCNYIKYIGLGDWIPLGKKMSMLMANTSSEIIVPNAADYYSSPRRLTSAYKIFKETNPDWVLTTKVIYYNIADGRIILHDTDYCKRKDDVSGRSMKASLLREVFPKPDKIKKTKGVDSFMFKSSKNYRQKQGKKLHICFDRSDNWKYCFNTNGINNISNRSPRFEKISYPYRLCPIKLKETIPPEILSKLASCRKIAKSRQLWSFR